MGRSAVLGADSIHGRAVAATAPGLVRHVDAGHNLAEFPDSGVVTAGHGRRQVPAL